IGSRLRLCRRPRPVGQLRSLEAGRTVQVLRPARLAARHVALAASRGVALALRSRLVRLPGREGARRAGAASAAGVVMDLLLAHGYFLSTDREEQRIMRPHPPLGLLYLSSHLKARCLDVGVFDSTFQRVDDFAARLQRDRPPIVGLAVNLMTKRNALRMID